jgi:hypothetical protein
MLSGIFNPEPWSKGYSSQKKKGFNGQETNKPYPEGINKLKGNL